MSGWSLSMTTSTLLLGAAILALLAAADVIVVTGSVVGSKVERKGRGVVYRGTSIRQDTGFGGNCQVTYIRRVHTSITKKTSLVTEEPKLSHNKYFRPAHLGLTRRPPTPPPIVRSRRPSRSRTHKIFSTETKQKIRQGYILRKLPTMYSSTYICMYCSL